MTERPSGWYDDPNDASQMRYWDGILWTDRTMPKLRPGLDHVGQARPVVHHDDPPRRDGEPRSYQAHWGPEEPQRNRQQFGPPQQYLPPQPPARRPGGPATIAERIGATVLDYFLVLFLSSFIISPLLSSRLDALQDYETAALDSLRGVGTTPAMTSDVLVSMLLLLGSVTAALVLYDTICTAAWGGATVGKRAFSIAVLPLADGTSPTHNPASTKVGWGRAFVRSLIKWFPAIVGAPGMAVAAFVLLVGNSSPKHQGLHDRPAGTAVQKRS